MTTRDAARLSTEQIERLYRAVDDADEAMCAFTNSQRNDPIPLTMDSMFLPPNQRIPLPIEVWVFTGFSAGRDLHRELLKVGSALDKCEFPEFIS
jgi:hypothetical protein